jgi:hypothetical protein
MRRHFPVLAILLLFGCVKEETPSTDTAALATDTTATAITATPSTTDSEPFVTRGRRALPDRLGRKSPGSLTDDDYEQLKRVLQEGRLGSRSSTRDIAALNVVQTITVFDDDGSAVQISSGPKTIVAQMATWCPYSKQYMQFLNDPATQAKLAGYTFIFLFEKDEWPTVERHLRDEAKESHLTEKEVQARLKELKRDAGYGPVFDPSFLLKLSGKHYFLPSDSKVFGGGFPSIYDPGVRHCSLHPGKVFPHLMDDTEFRKLWHRYDPQNS